MRTRRSRGVTLAMAGVCLLAVASAEAKVTPEQQCQKGRYNAAAKYAQCQQTVLAQLFLAKLFGDAVFDDKFEAALSKCRVKYTDTWAKLQAKASGTGATCDNPRYQDNGNGTVTDRFTALQWEKKTDDATVHDKDNAYTWSTTGDGDTTDGDGTTFASFLTALNGGGCFAGQCDWRLPTIYELQTILLEPYPCVALPCIDQAVFGPTDPDFYWSATTDAAFPFNAWGVVLVNGYAGFGSKTSNVSVRAVRAGL